MTETRINRTVLLTVLGLLIMSRALLLFTGYVGLNLFAKYTTIPTYEQNVPGSLSEWKLKLPGELDLTQKLQLQDFVKFDSYSYLKIATQGYDNVRIAEPHSAADWVFFPLYPLLIFLTGKLLLGLNAAWVGILLSHICLFFALLYVYLICMQRGFSERQAYSVLFLILIYPASLYFSVPYTESLFLLLSAGSIYYACDKKYSLAFLAASLSTVTRVPGFINLFFVIGTVALDENFRLSLRSLKWMLYSIFSLVPMGAYLYYMNILTGDFLAPFHEQSLNWFRYTTAPFKNYIGYLKSPYFSTPDGWDNGLIAFTVSTAVFLVYIGYLLRHIRTLFRDMRQLLFFVYGALLIVIPFSSQPFFLVSVVRYMMVCIPFYIYLVELTRKSETALRAYQLLFAVIWVMITIGFFNDYYFVI